MDETMKYQEASTFFRHCSTLRRSTVGFMFAATSASLGFVNLDTKTLCMKTLLISSVNVALCLGVLFQELQIHSYQSRLGKYLREQEKGDGPYTSSFLGRMRLGTCVVFIGACILFVCLWASIIVRQLLL